jgi:hypothetical protein
MYKDIKLTMSSKCEHCGKNHMPPLDLIDNMKWHLEYSIGYHRTGCSNSATKVYPTLMLSCMLQLLLPVGYEFDNPDELYLQVMAKMEAMEEKANEKKQTESYKGLKK